MRFEVDDWPRAVVLLGESVRVIGPGVVALDDGCATADLVARLVQGGVRVSAVEPERRNLEQIYLALTQNSASSAPPP